MSGVEVMLRANLACAWFMTGLVWFVQVVHYPLFGFLGAGAAKGYSHEHQRRTGWVVAPVMLAEAVTAAGVSWVRRGDAMSLAAAVMLVVIWGSTFLVQVPLHAEFERSGELATARKLVVTNWARTVLWTLRAVLLTCMLGA